MRFLVYALAFGGAALSVLPAHAAGWHSYSNHQVGVRFQYPPGWTITSSSMGPSRQLSLTSPGQPPYSLRLTVLPIKPGKTVTNTVARFIAYQRSQGNSSVAAGRWSAVMVGTRHAAATVFIPATEGGVPLSDGIFVTGARGHVYEIDIYGYHNPPLRQLRQFPAIYFSILRTWRFI